MSEWADYIKAVLKDKLTEDAALVGFYNKAVLASKPGGFMAAISPPELEALMGRDRRNLLETGTTVGGRKVLVIRDGMIGSSETELRFVDLRTKGADGKAITVVKTHKITVFLMGKRGVHAGFIHKKACAVASYLKDNGV